MTKEEFANIKPRKTIIKSKLEDGKCYELLVKFFVCYEDGEYAMCCTKDFSNPDPEHIIDTDFICYFNSSEIVKYE